MPYDAALVAVALMGAASCARAPALPKPADRDDGARRPPARQAPFELPDTVFPIAYDLRLDVEPERMSGRARIEIRVEEPTSVVWLHAAGLRQLRATVWQAGGQQGARVEARPDDEQIGLRLDRPLQQGRATLEIWFARRISPRSRGVFRRGDDVYTFFEPIAARRAFPCFDEPRFKTPWTLTLRVPEGSDAFSNAPIARVRPAPGAANRDEVSFARTRPLPSYLIAFAVGDFDSIDVTDDPKPTRIVYPAGMVVEAARVAAQTRQRLSGVEATFGESIPYPKLDILLVPAFPVWGMEHPGLISMMARIVHSEQYLSTLAHELIHLWLGDLVTLERWSEGWLNEGLTKWLQYDFLPAEEVLVRQSSIRMLDRGPDARAVRPVISSRADLALGFPTMGRRLLDLRNLYWWAALGWEKGAAIMSMIEQWLGEETTRAALRDYVDRHAHGSATTEDLADALATANPDVRSVLRTFVDQYGIPQLHVEPGCDGNGARLRVTQRRLGDPESPAAWTVPLCLEYTGGRFCRVLQQREQIVDLPDSTCPGWIHPNADGAGYYEVSMPPDHVRALVSRRSLSQTQLQRLVDGITGGVETETVTPSDALDLLAELAPQIDDETAIAGAAVQVARMAWPFAERKEHLARLASLMRPKLLELGLLDRDGDSPRIRRERAALVELIGLIAQDPETIREALAVVRGWIERRRDDARPSDRVLELAGRHGGDELRRLVPANLFDSVRDGITDRLMLRRAVADPEQTIWPSQVARLFSYPDTQREVFDLYVARLGDGQEILPAWRVVDALPAPPHQRVPCPDIQARQLNETLRPRLGTEYTGAHARLDRLLAAMATCERVRAATRSGR